MASLIKLFLTLEPSLRFYLRSQRIAEVHEAIISSLIVCQPKDPIAWLISCLTEYHSLPLSDKVNLNWDYFIPEAYRPVNRPFNLESSLSYVFAVCDDSLEPTEEQIGIAISHYKSHIQKNLFSAWLRCYLIRLSERRWSEKKKHAADEYYRARYLNIYFRQWLQWVKDRIERQKAAVCHLKHCSETYQLRIILGEWNVVAQQARRTRDYFDRIERGEDNQQNGSLGQGEARDELSMLNREAAVRILAYLDIADLARCSQVCRNWKMLTQSSMLWAKLDLHRTNKVLSDRLAMRFIQRARPFLQHLNLRQCSRIGRLTFLGISSCKNLQDLNLSECPSVDDESIKIITGGCHILLYLNLSHTSVTNHSFRHLARHCHFLQFLSVAYSRQFSDRAFGYLANGRGCRKLTHLDISGCTQLTPVGFDAIADAFRDLEILVMDDINNLSDKHMHNLCKRMTHLKQISMWSSARRLSGYAFRQMTSLTKLTTVKFDSNKLITDEHLRLICRSCSEICHLSIPDCISVTDMCMKHIGTLKHLRVLNVADCLLISDTGIKFLTEGACQNRLRELNLTNCMRISDSSITNLLRRCKRLAYLKLCYLDKITENGLELIGQMEQLILIDLTGTQTSDTTLKNLGYSGHLRSVILSSCRKITDLGLTKFTTACPNLEHLNLSFCAQLSDNAIRSMAFCCKYLTTLNICSCSLLTDMSLQYLSGVCKYLYEIDISYCQLITDKGLKCLGENSAYLKRVIVIECPNISRAAISLLLRRVPYVQYQYMDI
ncbi:unnamed protein product [Adineta steineri]|uniref:F-box domain-containing protein n=1 Tax=Adineta steineri TaxID=433720 RepID=A0A813U1M5_9BILA|nr:unnamed protein product [Adineta steineri]CAF0819484.1 unnamed protein product [Adineta steineri]